MDERSVASESMNGATENRVKSEYGRRNSVGGVWVCECVGV